MHAAARRVVCVETRKFENLHLAGVRNFPETCLRLFDVSQSLDRRGGEGRSDHTGAMAPQGRRYISTRCRILLGVEEMHLQSLRFDESALLPFDNKFLSDLAGNAVEVSCCSVVMFCALSLLATGATDVVALATAPSASHGADSDGDSDTASEYLALLWRKKRSSSFLGWSEFPSESAREE